MTSWSNGDGGMSIERPIVQTAPRRPLDRQLAARTTV